VTSGGPPPPPPPQGPWGGGQQYPPPSPYVPPPAYPATYYQPVHAGPAPGIGYAGFWIRFLAVFIDGIIIDVPLLIILFATEGTAISSYSTCVSNAINNAAATGSSQISICANSLVGSLGYFELIGLGVSFLYFVLLWSKLGGTLGQRLLGLRVVDAATGTNIGIGRAIGRYIGYLISSAVLAIGLIWAAFDPRKQGWHDKMASTFVVRKL